ncbi:MAG: tryptophan synthase subunit alpha [Candidatus Eisenbacteria bacterium]|uniref:Tryptophan synthase alpha chain n=1 Tax=Eiseniibacteriota bacterium TaxID=2212470 RepID=A0A956SDS4_UNCEI|nr:tryptophan synthase subunit alpha [Candidatus Eisenbacteria bacterium]MCB9466327.1 tryptophan synthase subunit alpha [Candidatus Eisenbacteria bacterium]
MPTSPRAALAARRAQGQSSIIPYLTAGYPDWDRFDEAASGLVRAGADVFELGVPFSDPLADGPTIQRASQAALENGVTLEQILDRVASRREAWGLPVVLMTYVNPIVAYGIERFCRRAQEAGVGGVLISDLPPEETPELWSALAAHGIETAVLTAPTTKAERLPALAAATTGFLYCVSRTGVTGRGKDYAGNLGDQIDGLRAQSEVPVVVGFGIRSPEDAVRVRETWNPDGVVLGARLIEILEGEGGVTELHGFLSGIREALDAADGPSGTAGGAPEGGTPRA